MFRRDMPDHNAPLTRRQFLAIVQADRRAREDGVRGRPETAAPDIMRDVVEMLQERIGKRRSELLEDELALRDLCLALKDKAKRNNAYGLARGVRDKILGMFQTLGGVIRQTMGLFRQSEAELKAFQSKHGLLERDAVYPLSRIKHYGLLGVLALSEAGSNAAMTVVGSQSGWLGALLASVGVTVLTLGLACLAGLCFRYINLPEVDHE